MRVRPVILGVLLLVVPGSAAAQAGGDIAALCGARKPCELFAATPAGRDAQGRALTVIEINLDKKNPENNSGDDRFDCRPHRREFWVRVEGVAEAQRIFEICNTGYGAAGIGEDEIKIGDNRLVHTRNGGSAWRWYVTRSIQLSPLRVRDEEHCSYHNVAPGFITLNLYWAPLSGEARWTPKRCTGREQPDDEIGCVPDKPKRSYIAIPQIEGAFERAGGKRLHLGSCSTLIDESGQRGFILHGAPRANGAELRALLLSNRDLVVTVTDDKFTTGAASWVNDDHIELWLGHGRTNLECENEKPANLRQWGIGLDGKVHAGHGNARIAPRLIARLERKVGARAQVTLHLFLPEDVDGITLAYSKSAGGKQERLVASSPIRRADATTLGTLWRIDAKAVACADKDGQLELTDSGLPALLVDP